MEQKNEYLQTALERLKKEKPLDKPTDEPAPADPGGEPDELGD